MLILAHAAARSMSGRCHSFDESAEVIARVGFRMFLGTAAAVAPLGWNADKTSFALLLDGEERARERKRERVCVYVWMCALTRVGR